MSSAPPAIENGQTRRPRGRPRTDDVVALETRLISVASQIFFRDGYGATTMSAVAKAARVSKTTLYTRFPSKADLFRAIVAAQIESWESGINSTRTPERLTLVDELRVYGNVMLRAGTSPDFIHLNRLLYSESERFPELAAIADTRFRLGTAYLSDRIRAFAQRDGIPCRDPLLAAELFIMMVNGWISNVVLTNRVIAIEARAAWLDDAIERFLGGRSAL